VTSVLGHLTCTDFDADYKGWHNCDPFSLFDAPIHRFVNPVSIPFTDLRQSNLYCFSNLNLPPIQDHTGIERNLKAEARRADKLMIWTDCDREGEHIGSEIVSVCRAVKPGIIVLRARFSAIIPASVFILETTSWGLRLFLGHQSVDSIFG
jgi:DNA topoisomerase-3